MTTSTEATTEALPIRVEVVRKGGSEYYYAIFAVWEGGKQERLLNAINLATALEFVVTKYDKLGLSTMLQKVIDGYICLKIVSPPVPVLDTTSKQRETQKLLDMAKTEAVASVQMGNMRRARSLCDEIQNYQDELSYLNAQRAWRQAAANGQTILGYAEWMAKSKGGPDE